MVYVLPTSRRRAHLVDCKKLGGSVLVQVGYGRRVTFLLVIITIGVFLLLQGLGWMIPTFDPSNVQVDPSNVQVSDDTLFRKKQNLWKSISETKSQDIFFLHIGKTGGTSIDGLMTPMMKDNKRRRRRQLRYHGGKHFDWTYVEAFQKKHQQKESQERKTTVDVITFFRDPVERVLSQFYYSKTIDFFKRRRMYNQSIEEFLNDSKSQQEYGMTLDGMGGPSWLTGIFDREWRWIETGDDKPAKKKDESHHIRIPNRTALCLLAAEHLEQTSWFGFLEDIDRSLKLLQIYLELDSPPTLEHKNSNRRGRVSSSQQVLEKIRNEIPMDIWLYEYAKMLFNARWKSQVEGQPYIPPPLPPFPWE